MTRKEKLNRLQYLHIVINSGSTHVELTGRRSRSEIALLGIIRAAESEWWRLTGISPVDVSMVELNNGTPSERIAKAIASREKEWKD